MAFREHRITTQEGLGLYARDYGSHDAPVVLCLPGLTRNSRDFHDLAEHLSPRYRVIAPDFRGRGRSNYAPVASAYTPDAETRDVIDLMAALSIHQAAVIGTSRGGLVAMLLAAQRPSHLRAVVLNDIGPVVEAEGIRRIASYAGVMSVPATWGDLVISLKRLHGEAYRGLSDEEWMAFARNTFRDENGAPALDYDPKIGKAVRRAALLTRGRVPPLWGAFNALKPMPLLVVRGAHSDILSSTTLDEMRRRHPDFTSVTILDRGHAPLLNEPEAVAAIDAFLDGVTEMPRAAA